MASVAKSNFVANMSHEIRTPLNVILGFAQVLDRDASLTPKQAEHLRAITRSGRHLLHLINDILEMAKIEAGRQQLNPGDFGLHDLLDDLAMMFRSRANAKGLHLIMERHDNVPSHVNADESKLRQVLVNVMGNAVKFTSVGGVAVRVRCEPCTEEEAEGEGEDLVWLAVEVEDTGPGISDDDRERVFESFQQAEAGIREGGTGLGLAICDRLVTLMGGRIELKSTVGKGTCLSFRIPVKLAEVVVRETVEPGLRVVALESGQNTVRVLVVDDIEENRGVARALLEPVGFEIKEAANGREGLDVFEQWEPHAVLMDMRMPVMDGYEATRRIKASPAGRMTAVIALTASAFDDDKHAVFAAGVNAYLRKPFSPEELFSVLAGALGLRYVYEDALTAAAVTDGAGALAVTDISELPGDLLLEMNAAVESGDMAVLRTLLPRVAQINDRVARGLELLAKEYDYQKLTELLKPKKTP